VLPTVFSDIAPKPRHTQATKAAVKLVAKASRKMLALVTTKPKTARGL